MIVIATDGADVACYGTDPREKVPAAAPSPASVLAAREATFAVFFREAPPIAARNGIPWPSRLEQAVRDHLREQGVPLPGREG
jgi:hypothetical protein